MSDIIPSKNKKDPTKAPKNSLKIRRQSLENLKKLKGAESSEIIKALIKEEQAKLENEEAGNKIDEESKIAKNIAKHKYSK